MIDYKGGEQFEIDLPTRDAMFKDFLEKYVQDDHHSDKKVREVFDVSCATTEQFVQRMIKSIDIFPDPHLKMVLLLFSIKVSKMVIRDFDNDMMRFMTAEGVRRDPLQDLLDLIEKVERNI